MNIYPTNLTDNQYDTILRIIGDTRKRQRSLKGVFDALFYLLKTGCQWRMLPSDFPNWERVYYYFQKWSRDGAIEAIHEVFRKRLRKKRGGGIYRFDTTHALDTTLHPNGWTDGTFSIPLLDTITAPVVNVDEAVNTANIATARLTQWASDAIISPTEKTALKQQRAQIVADYAASLAEAQRQTVATTAFTAAYSAAIAAIDKYTATAPESITIEADYHDIAAYYTSAQAIRNAVGQVTDLSYLKKAFANGSTTVAGGVVLSEFIGIKEGEKVVAGMSNGKIGDSGLNTPLLFAGADDLLTAMQTAKWMLDSNGTQKSRDEEGNTITINSGVIAFESMVDGALVHTTSMVPKDYPVTTVNPVTAFASPDLLGEASGSFNVQIPASNINLDGYQNIPLPIDDGRPQPIEYTQLWSKTIPLGTAFNAGGDTTVSIPAMTFLPLVNVQFTHILDNPIHFYDHTIRLYLRNEETNATHEVDARGSMEWSVTTLAVVVNGLPKGRYRLYCQSIGRADIGRYQFNVTANCNASMSISDAAFAVSWSSTKSNSRWFGNGFLFSRRTNKYCGIIGDEDNYVFEQRSGDIGFRADSTGAKVWCAARNEWIPADRVLYKGYVRAGGSMDRKWAYKGIKPSVSRYSTGVYKVDIRNNSLKAGEDYLVRCTGIGTGTTPDNRYASVNYISNGIFHVITVNGNTIMDGDFFFEVVDITDMK